MAINPLALSIKSAVRMNYKIGDLFARIGTTQAHPRGEITAAYTSARLAMKAALDEDDPLNSARDVLRNLRRQLLLIIAALFRDSIALGEEEALRQLDWYESEPGGSIALTEQSNSATNVVMSRFDVQDAAIIALILAGMSAGQILGDGVSAGILAATDITNAASYWTANMVWSSFDDVIGRGGKRFSKVAVAVLDDRTTDCCLRVHGQVQPFREPFKLTGTPRFADEMNWPGFHWHCRTSVAVYEEKFDTGLTDKMRTEAAILLKARRA